MIHRQLLMTGAIAAAAAFSVDGAFAISPVPQATVLSAELRGAAEVPGPGDPDGSGTFSATIDRATREMCYKLDVTDIATPTMAHVHVGDRIHADIVVQPLSAPLNGHSEGCVVVPKRTARHLMLIPQEYYVNVHNADFPNGAIRGQLLK